MKVSGKYKVLLIGAMHLIVLPTSSFATDLQEKLGVLTQALYAVNNALITLRTPKIVPIRGVEGSDFPKISTAKESDSADLIKVFRVTNNISDKGGELAKSLGALIAPWAPSSSDQILIKIDAALNAFKNYISEEIKNLPQHSVIRNPQQLKDNVNSLIVDFDIPQFQKKLMDEFLVGFEKLKKVYSQKSIQQFSDDILSRFASLLKSEDFYKWRIIGTYLATGQWNLEGFPELLKDPEKLYGPMQGAILEVSERLKKVGKASTQESWQKRKIELDKLFSDKFSKKFTDFFVVFKAKVAEFQWAKSDVLLLEIVQALHEFFDSINNAVKKEFGPVSDDSVYMMELSKKEFKEKIADASWYPEDYFDKRDFYERHGWKSFSMKIEDYLEDTANKFDTIARQKELIES